MANILLAGLDRETAAEFSRKLNQLGHRTELERNFYNQIESSEPDLIFTFGDDVLGMSFVSSIRSRKPSTPVVVVSRFAEDDRWIAALDAGATDYCTSGIDLGNLRWIVENALTNERSAVAAA